MKPELNQIPAPAAVFASAFKSGISIFSPSSCQARAKPLAQVPVTQTYMFYTTHMSYVTYCSFRRFPCKNASLANKTPQNPQKNARVPGILATFFRGILATLVHASKTPERQSFGALEKKLAL